jgi:uncharacterized membrane protein
MRPDHVRGVWHSPVRACLLLSGVSLALFTIRLSLVAHPTFSFLTWNLLLAWIPFELAVAMEYVARRGRPYLLLGLLGLVWLVFFPNAPYIVTDLVHVETWSTRREVVDVGTIAAFAATGLVLGYGSLVRVQTLVRASLGAVAGWGVALGALMLSGAGVYLGRVLQLNSWDVVRRPGRLLEATRPSFADPSAHTRAFVFSALAGAMLALAYILCYHAWGENDGTQRDLLGTGTRA